MVAITKEEFLNRFQNKFPEENIEILEYTAVSRPVRIKCKWCGKEHYYGTGDQLLASFRCCQDARKKLQNKIESLYSNNEEYELVGWKDQKHAIILHKVCARRAVRSMASCLNEPYKCLYCNSQ